MGFFDALFGKPSSIDIRPDRIWLSEDAKFRGFEEELQARLETTDAVAILLVAHFPDVLARLEPIAQSAQAGRPVSAALASNLNADLAANLRLDESSLIEILAAERHPSFAQEQRFEEFVHSLPCRCNLYRYVSLDDPLMQIFAGAWVKEVLTSLDMPEAEAIESAMVSRRILSSQRQVDKKLLSVGVATSTNEGASSAKEWLEKGGCG